MGMNDRISSVRPRAQYAQFDNEAPAPLPAPTYEYRRRPQEQMFEVPVPPVGDVRHCEASSKGQPVYWDVTYDFQGVQHQVQVATQPGATISVNSRGEPRQ